METNDSISSTPEPSSSTGPLISDKRRMIPFSFGAAIFCFLLPFLDLRCSEQKIATYSGLDLVMGKDLPSGDFFDEGGSESNVPPNIWALIALGASVVGLYVFMQKQKTSLTTGRISAIVGIASLLILQMTSRSNANREGMEQGVVTINFLIGYWVCILSLIAAAYLCHTILKEEGDGSTPAAPPENKAGTTTI